MALTKKLAIAIVCTGLVPAIVIGVLAYRTASHMSEDVAAGYESLAENLGDKIDRNLFERYGDVQAFGANDAVNDQKSWYQVGSEKNKIAAAANRYANLYGFYLLSYVVDLEGKVIAVNDKDPSGKAIDTAWLYQKNFKDAAWFKESLAGHFMKSETLDGTFVEDVQADEDVKKAYGNDGLVLGFSAPVRDANGKVVGVWHNCANFSLVEELVSDAYNFFKENNLTTARLSLLDHTGRVIVDYNPSSNGGKSEVQHDSNVLLKQNLAELGLASAKNLAAGKAGHEISVDPATKLSSVSGYAVCDGELGFPGLKWGVLVRVPEKEALAAVNSQIHQILATIGISIAALIGVGVWLGRSISRPLVQGITSIHQVGEQVSTAAREVATSSQTTAEGASEQAASLEETSASLEEISAMTKRNADNAASSKTLSNQARESAASGLERISEMGRTLNTVKGAVGEMESAVSEMQSSSQEIAKIIKTIDEIAFQTNLLALNAAVEAARAGEAGAGFAVVADEVRSLAQRSAQAARDTSEKIEAAVKRSALGGVASKKVVSSLGEIEGNARNIEQVFNGIVSQVKSLDEIIGEISAASKEQSQGIAEVNMAVGQMDKVTQGNAASAEENASAAEEMTGQVASLQAIVQQLQAVVSGASSGQESVVQNSPPQPKAVTARSSKSAAKAKAKLPAAPPAPGFRNVPDDRDIPMPEPVGNGQGGFQDF